MKLNPESSLGELLSLITKRIDNEEPKWNEKEREDAPRFEAFSFFLRREVADSRIIAALLSTDATHGQGGLFLDLFLRRIGINPDRLDLKATTIDCEYEILEPQERPNSEKSFRRIDVLVKLSNGAVVAIENKSRGAKDQSKQVKAYLDWLGLNYPEKFCFLYLSNCRQPASIAQEEWDSYRGVARSIPVKFVTDWLAACREKVRAPKVVKFLDDFSQHLEEGWVMEEGDFIKSHDAQRIVVSTCTSTEFMRATAAILSHRDMIWQRLWTPFLQEIQTVAEESLQKAGYRLDVSGWEGGWYNINVAHPSWQHLIRVTFETGPEEKTGSQFCQQGVRSLERPEPQPGYWKHLTDRLEDLLGRNNRSNWIWRRTLSELTDLRSPNQLLKVQRPNDNIGRIGRDFVDLIRKAAPILKEFANAYK